MLAPILSKRPEAIRKGVLEYLDTHRKWYARWVSIYGKLWNGLNMSIMILGAVTSILVAGGGADKGSAFQGISIVLPALASLFSSCLIQFRVRDTWQLRESGRLDVENLIVAAYLLPTEDAKATLEAAMKLRLEAHEIERRQASQFFGSHNTEAPSPNDANRGQSNEGAIAPQPQRDD